MSKLVEAAIIEARFAGARLRRSVMEHIAAEQQRRERDRDRDREPLSAFGTADGPNGFMPVEARIISEPTPYEADPNRPRRPF